MRLVVKKWGNGIAVRLPRRADDYGRLEEGDEVDVEVKPVRNLDDWQPYLVDLGPPDLSENMDDYMADVYDHPHGGPPPETNEARDKTRA